MAPERSAASFWTRSNALLRKSLTYQKRNIRSNITLVLIPFFFIHILAALQSLQKNVNKQLSKPDCGSSDQFDLTLSCPIPQPQEWAPLLQLPSPDYRAVRSNFLPSDLPDESCRSRHDERGYSSCPVTLLLTGNNQSLGETLAGNMLLNSPPPKSAGDGMEYIAHNVMGSDSTPQENMFHDYDWSKDVVTIYNVQRHCSPNSSFYLPVREANLQSKIFVECVEGLPLWRNTSTEVNNELYRGYRNGNSEGKINEVLGAYDFSNSDKNNFNVSVWYNSSLKSGDDDVGEVLSGAGSDSKLLRLPRAVNLASSAYLRFLKGFGTNMLLDFGKEMPKQETPFQMPDIASMIGPLFFTWVILLLFPVVMKSLVYEKQQKLRIMMKMHGLGDGPYWMISYAYFLTVSIVYMLCLVISGSLIGLKIFRLHDYTIQFVFYFLYMNLQIAMAFLAAALFSNVKACTVIGYILVFATGLFGSELFQAFIEDPSFPRYWIIVLELYPGLSLYRGLYEFAEFTPEASTVGTVGMRWGNLRHSKSGMREVLIVMFVEWFVLIFIAYNLDKLASSVSGKSPLFFLQSCFGKNKEHSSSLSSGTPSAQRQGSTVSIQMDKPDVTQEMEKVESLLLDQDSTSHAIICHDLKKVYPGRDGNPEKFAVKGLSLALPRGECFGMLGPNGAGKTSFISMMIGLTKPSSGAAYVHGMDIWTQMDEIYTSMGVCPQHDLLWESLTGREHLLFYGRLKNLKGSALIEAVEESLKSVNLFYGGVADKQAGKYSGGMKRRLSVAISLIGDPKVVYMDEPSTGLDPASRNHLWNVVKAAKQDRAILLTTHSMEEAEVLCDRLGIFVDGRLQCIGNPKELKARYGGSYIFTMTTSGDHEEEVEKMVRTISPNANKVYRLSGTQKFELPKNEVTIARVFQAVEAAKRQFTVFAWGLTDTTLEDVFIKVATTASQ
ncbi:ABC transporter A family member 7-like [Rosa sericea]